MVVTDRLNIKNKLDSTYGMHNGQKHNYYASYCNYTYLMHVARYFVNNYLDKNSQE